MIFKIRNIVIILIPLFFLLGCNAVKDVASTLNYEKGNVECLLAFADKQKCMVKRLSSSQLCSNFKNWEDKKNVSKELYEATLQEIKLRNYKCENIKVVKASSKSNSEISKNTNSITSMSRRDVMSRSRTCDFLRLIRFRMGFLLMSSSLCFQK